MTAPAVALQDIPANHRPRCDLRRGMDPCTCEMGGVFARQRAQARQAADPYADVPPPVDAPHDPWETPSPVPDQDTAGTPTRLYVDVAALLADGLPEPPAPQHLRRDDGHALFYAGKVNVLFGDPECGKTFIALAACAEALTADHRVTVLDVDHNGATEIITRLVLLGAPTDALTDPRLFRLYEPEDADELRQVITQVRGWKPAVAVVDSIGEIMPMLGLSSNSPDDYSAAHREVFSALASAGAAVIAIDHMPKSEDARARGQTGTVAKNRTVDGANLRVTLAEPFVPGHGGAANLRIHKDRHGGIRAHCPTGDKNPPAGRFVLTVNGGQTHWHVTSPDGAMGQENGPVNVDDVADLDSLNPPPTTIRDVKTRLGWGTDRASTALKYWKEQRAA